MTLFINRRSPIVAIQINGSPAPEFEDARTRFRYVDRLGKRDKAELEVADPKRRFRDELLKVDDFYRITWGYLGNMSRPRGMRLKTWETAMDAEMPIVSMVLQVTSADPKKGTKGISVPSEPHKTRIARNWGKVTTSSIAQKVARRHGLKFKGDNSDDADSSDYVQSMNVSDYGYLRRLSENIDFEFFIESGTLYYRKKPYSESPRRSFTYIPGEGDNLLIRFTPNVKVVSVKTKPNAVDVEQGERPWTSLKQDVVEYAAGAFKKEKDKIEDAVRFVTDRTDDAWQTGEALREVLQDAPTDVDSQKDLDTINQQLTDNLRVIAASKRTARDAQKPVDKQARANRQKRYGDDDGGAETCPKSQKFNGNEPTGNSKTSEENLFLEFGEHETTEKIGRQSLEARYGFAESTVYTADSTEKNRKKKACAAHSKLVDKAVTARADFWGDPFLRAKVVYEFKNVGRLFNGNWYAKEVSHDLPAGAYTVSMELKRGSLKSKRGSRGKRGKDKTTDNTGVGENEAVVVLDIESGSDKNDFVFTPTDLPRVPSR